MSALGADVFSYFHSFVCEFIIMEADSGRPMQRQI